MKSKWILALCSLLAFSAAGATSTRERIQTVYQGAPGGYQLYIFGGQNLRCRAENLHIARDERGDGDGPIILECR